MYIYIYIYIYLYLYIYIYILNGFDQQRTKLDLVH